MPNSSRKNKGLPLSNFLQPANRRAGRGKRYGNAITRPLRPSDSQTVEDSMASLPNIAARRPRPPFLARVVGGLNTLVAGIPYAVIALGLRFLMARVFFPEGQSRIEGP